MENLYEDFGKFIKKLRKKHGMSRKVIADKLGLNSQSSIMNFENGRTAMRLQHIASFAKLLPGEISPAILMSMFEADSIEPPCSCICHYDFANSHRIYDADGRCCYCNHIDDDCYMKNGIFFVKVKQTGE